MRDFEKVYDFYNLYKAHLKARRGKQCAREVVDFELNLAARLTELSESIRDGSYSLSDYYEFKVYDPKIRNIHALHYKDRVFQHCLCDEVIAPLIERKLIYDKAACRKEKGTHFAMGRLSHFMSSYYWKENSANGYVLKCDIRKYFENIDHEILKNKLAKVFSDPDILRLIFMIIDSYEIRPGKGLPLGNQSSQWFALYYLDSLDRLVKEKLKVSFYTRYMDDAVLIHQDRDYLKYCLECMDDHLRNHLGLEFNQKTQIVPMRSGVDYLGFHFYLTDSGKVIRKMRTSAKKRFKKKLKLMKNAYSAGKMELEDITPVIVSYKAHFAHGHNHGLMKNALNSFVLHRSGYC